MRGREGLVTCDNCGRKSPRNKAVSYENSKNIINNPKDDEEEAVDGPSDEQHSGGRGIMGKLRDSLGIVDVEGEKRQQKEKK